MSESTSILEQIQETVRGHINGMSPFLGKVKAVSRKKGNIQSQLDEQLAELGMGIVVLPPLPRRVKPNLPGPHFGNIQVAIKVIEVPVLDQSGMSALEVAEKILKELHHREFKIRHANEQSYVLKSEESPIVPLDEEIEYNIVEVYLYTSASIKQRDPNQP